MQLALRCWSLCGTPSHTHQEVKHAESQEVKCQTDVSVVVKPVKQLHTEAEEGMGSVDEGECGCERGGVCEGGV